MSNNKLRFLMCCYFYFILFSFVYDLKTDDIKINHQRRKKNNNTNHLKRFLKHYKYYKYKEKNLKDKFHRKISKVNSLRKLNLFLKALIALLIGIILLILTLYLTIHIYNKWSTKKQSIFYDKLKKMLLKENENKKENKVEEKTIEIENMKNTINSTSSIFSNNNNEQKNIVLKESDLELYKPFTNIENNDEELLLN